MKVLVEGIGSMTFGPELKYYREINWNVVGIDISKENFGVYKCDNSYIVPKYSEEGCFESIEKVISEEKIDAVFPTINEGLPEWSRRKEYFREKYNANVVISNKEAIDICTDKWKTYKFFCNNNIPTPETSLDMEFELLKPRIGRGSSGICYKKDVYINFNMNGYISQKIVSGEEYTIDVLCDFDSKPIYIIPRKRLFTESGVSVKGVTVYNERLIEYTKMIIDKLKPIGIINIQCFKDNDEINFIEINPRLAGGSSLSFASSDNWFKAIECFINGDEYIAKEITYNNYMFRYYEDLIINKRDM